jgi:uncharacterized membrane protein
MRTALLLAAVPLLAAGCNTSSPGGPAPGTANSFKLDLPVTTTTIKQGTSETVKVKLDRGKEFKEGVALKVTAPDHVKAELSKSTIAAADPPEVELKLTAEKDAAQAEGKVVVTGTPDKGAAVTKDFTIKVTAP